MRMEWKNLVWARLMVNFRGGTVRIFDIDGHFIAEELFPKKKVYWLSLKAANFVGIDVVDNDSDNNFTSDDRDKFKVAASRLDFFLGKLNFSLHFQSFMNIIQDALRRLDHAPNSYAGQVPAIFRSHWRLSPWRDRLNLRRSHCKIKVGTWVQARQSKMLSWVQFLIVNSSRKFETDHFSDGLVGYVADKSPCSCQRICRIHNSFEQLWLMKRRKTLQGKSRQCRRYLQWRPKHRTRQGYLCKSQQTRIEYGFSLFVRTMVVKNQSIASPSRVPKKRMLLRASI